MKTKLTTRSFRIFLKLKKSEQHPSIFSENDFLYARKKDPLTRVIIMIILSNNRSEEMHNKLTTSTLLYSIINHISWFFFGIKIITIIDTKAVRDDNFPSYFFISSRRQENIIAIIKLISTVKNTLCIKEIDLFFQ